MEALVARLVRLPGIGRRSAQRLAFHLAREKPDELAGLARAIEALPRELQTCTRCGNLAAGELCAICSDPRRDESVICVVEQPENVAAIERSGAFRGVYHVLGGAISPLRSVGPDDLRIDGLLERVAAGGVEEVILATNPTVEGEATALYIARQLRDRPVRVTRPATGIPVGGDLEYVDEATLSRALAARRGVLDED
ncbi:MAG: recombination protein RecR [Acidobacteria bacterium]|nr:MAG: recombination protein RecR [Acidobacteriota bacterium]